MPEKVIEPDEKHCLECGKALGAGRSDRKYCDDICRTAFNNRRRSDPTEQSFPGSADQDMTDIDRVHQILLDNRNKLLRMYESYAYQISLDDFNRFGINLKYFTSFYVHDEWGRLFKMCFDYGYEIDDHCVWLIQNAHEIRDH